eukprot:SAG11_NODE_146_length_14788_cov_5.672884_11_plen_45_part_00
MYRLEEFRARINQTVTKSGVPMPGDDDQPLIIGLPLVVNSLPEP